jgi:hypothetical protein
MREEQWEMEMFSVLVTRSSAVGFFFLFSKSSVISSSAGINTR